MTTILHKYEEGVSESPNCSPVFKPEPQAPSFSHWLGVAQSLVFVQSTVLPPLWSLACLVRVVRAETLSPDPSRTCSPQALQEANSTDMAAGSTHLGPRRFHGPSSRNDTAGRQSQHCFAYWWLFEGTSSTSSAEGSILKARDFRAICPLARFPARVVRCGFQTAFQIGSRLHMGSTLSQFQKRPSRSDGNLDNNNPQ